MSFNFMAAVTICSDFGTQENNVCHCFHCFPPSICQEVMGPDVIIYFYEISMFTCFTLTFYDHLHYIKRLRLSADSLLILTFAFLLGLCNSPDFFRACTVKGSLIFCLWKLENSAHFVSILEAISGSPGRVFFELYFPLYLTVSPAACVPIMFYSLSKSYFFALIFSSNI